MYSNLNDRISLYTRRNKTESKYLSQFLDWCESFSKTHNKPGNLVRVIELLKSHCKFNKFKVRIKIGAMYTGGSVASIDLEVAHPQFKIPVVGFVQKYNPEELRIPEANQYIEKLESIEKE